MPDIYYSDASKFEDFISALGKDYRVFGPVVKEPSSKETDYSYNGLSASGKFVFNAYRTTEPLKSFFTHPKEVVAEYFNKNKSPAEPVKTVIFGIKSCDLAAHRVQDFVFLEGTDEDSLYRLRKENTILISSDCTDFKEVCHCLSWEIMPYPTEGFDLNLSPLDSGYLVEAGSGKGEGLIQQHKEFFVKAGEKDKATVNTKRENLVSRLKRHLAPQNLVSKDIVQRLVKEGYSLDTWKQFMLTCVECGGCNLICDTCHCFLLADKKEGLENKKVRAWDSCLYANYARVAGGANPLKTRTQRLRNRFMKKFDFFVDSLGSPACCGCGRCIEVCPGKIDIREVLKDLATKLNVKT